jgi:hypothetical protein
MAKDDNTTIQVNGTIVTTINKGESYSVKATMGAQITTTKPVQAHLLTGEVDSGRFVLLWDGSCSMIDTAEPVFKFLLLSRVFFFNPSQVTNVVGIL